MCRPFHYPVIGASPLETGDKPSPQQTGAPNHHPLDESSTGGGGNPLNHFNTDTNTQN